VQLRNPRTGGIGVELAVGMAVCASLAVGLCGLHLARTEAGTGLDEEETRQLTLFGVAATLGTKTVDTNLTSIKPQLDKLLPKHGFKLLDAQSKLLGSGDSVACDLRNGYTVVASLIQQTDENGKVQIRCELFQDQRREFSTVVKTPPNQLFFCQRALQDGTQLLIGVGAR
jgi:hypothetical protein